MYFYGHMENIKEKIILMVGSGKVTTQREIAKVLKVPISTINYHFSKLRKEKSIGEKNELLTFGRRKYNFLIHWDNAFSQKLRAHKIQIKLNIVENPNFSELQNKGFSPFTNKHYKGLKIELENSTLLFYSPKSAVLNLPDIFANTNEEILAQINACIIQIQQILFKEFEIIIEGYEIYKFSSMHIAIPNSLVAQNYLLEKKHILTANQGFSIDNSHNKPELEVENLDKIFEKIGICAKYEDLAKENEQLKEIIKILEINQI